MKNFHKFQGMQRTNTSPYKPVPYEKGSKQQNTIRKAQQVTRRPLGSASNISLNEQKINNQNYYKERMIALTKANSQLQNKQIKYIQKLKKLEQGLENQYVQSMKLQQLYQKLLDSYKIKQQQIKQLQFRYQQFQQSSRKKNDTDVDYQAIIENLKNQKQILEKLLNSQKRKSLDLEVFYQQNKSIVEKHKNQCINASNTPNYQLRMQDNLQQKVKQISNTRLITQFMNMQDQINNQKQHIFKLQYENQYLKKRHSDLESYRNQIDKLISVKQAQIQKLRQDKISLLRNQTDRKLNTSPRDKDRMSSSRKIDQKNKNLLINENRQLKAENQSLKSEINSLNRLVHNQKEKIYILESQISKIDEKQKHIHGNIYGKHDDFFSFSKEDIQSKDKMELNEQIQQQQEIIQDEQKRANDLITQQNQRLMKLIEIKQTNDDLPPFPQQLQIDSLIRNMDNKKSKSRTEEIDDSKWEVAQK